MDANNVATLVSIHFIAKCLWAPGHDTNFGIFPKLAPQCWKQMCKRSCRFLCSQRHGLPSLAWEWDWPAKSPDLKPTEHIWDELKHRPQARPFHPASVTDFTKALGSVCLIDVHTATPSHRCGGYYIIYKGRLNLKWDGHKSGNVTDFQSCVQSQCFNNNWVVGRYIFSISCFFVLA